MSSAMPLGFERREWHIFTNSPEEGPGSLSIIIPVLNEGTRISSTIRRVAELFPSCEIIVVDGGSGDDTRVRVLQTPARLVLSGGGRGIQCNAGAACASGEWLMFLHADTTLPAEAPEILQEMAGQEGFQAGLFRLRFDREGILFRIYAGFTRFECMVSSFGDQCIVIRRSGFRKLGGFQPWPLFEDVDFLRRARRTLGVVRLPAEVTTSARRFTAMGPLRAQLYNGFLILLYMCGIHPRTLAKLYRRRFDPGAKITGGANGTFSTGFSIEDSTSQRKLKERPT